MGAPIARTPRTSGDAQDGAVTLRSAAIFAGQTLQNGLEGEMMTVTLRAPAGVAGGIIPWNGPMLSQWWIIGPTLATGCAAVIKPSEEASLSVLRTAELSWPRPGDVEGDSSGKAVVLPGCGWILQHQIQLL